jgi:hypothetical protein
MDLEQQLSYFDANVQLAYDRCLQEFADDRPQITAKARERLIDGYPAYGMKGWLWCRFRLKRERREEYADAVNYRVMQLWQELQQVAAALVRS